ncbi:MAG: helix-turn-helix domain-containing protein [Streptococcus sp.]
MKTYEKIYYTLLEKKDYVSGEDLAQRLHVSRTSIWKGKFQTLWKKRPVKLRSGQAPWLQAFRRGFTGANQLNRDLNIPVFYHDQASPPRWTPSWGLTTTIPTPANYLAPHQETAKGSLAMAGSFYL